jgi:hypothetical protein
MRFQKIFISEATRFVIPDEKAIHILPNELIKTFTLI